MWPKRRLLCPRSNAVSSGERKPALWIGTGVEAEWPTGSGRAANSRSPRARGDRPLPLATITVRALRDQGTQHRRRRCIGAGLSQQAV